MQGIAYKINGEPRVTWPVVTEVFDGEGNPTGETISNLDQLIAELPEGVEYQLVDEDGAAAWWGANYRGQDYQRQGDGWMKIRFTKKEFLLWCGVENIVKLNAAIAGGNMLAKTAHDLVFAAEYIDVTDPDTVQLVQLLTTEAAGAQLAPAEAARILAGKPYEN